MQSSAFKNRDAVFGLSNRPTQQLIAFFNGSKVFGGEFIQLLNAFPDIL